MCVGGEARRRRWRKDGEEGKKGEEEGGEGEGEVGGGKWGEGGRKGAKGGGMEGREGEPLPKNIVRRRPISNR